MNPTNYRNYIVCSVMILVELFFLLYPAILNGYPLLYSDSVSYIVSGYEGNVPVDRPIVYGLFVKIFSWWLTSWMVIIAQAAIIILLTHYMFRFFTNVRSSFIFSFFTILILSILTGLSNYVSQIMPDIFTGIMIWSIFLFFISQKKHSTLLLSILIVFSSLVHFSNLLTMTILAGIIVLCIWLFKNWRIYRKASVRLVFLIGIAWFLHPTINLIFAREFYISKSGNVFLMARLIETGTVKDYLNENCNSKNYPLCNSIDKLPEHAWQFLWNDDSPLYEGGCIQNGGWGNCWIAKQNEYGLLIRDILTNPKYLKRIVKVSISDMFKQMVVFDIGHLTQQGANSGFDPIIKKYFLDYPLYSRAKQYNQDLFFKTESKIQNTTIIISVLLIFVSALYLFLKKGKNGGYFCFPIFVFGTGIVINAANCSFFASVLNRYQGRIIWLLPLVVLLFFFELYYHQNIKNAKTDLPE